MLVCARQALALSGCLLGRQVEAGNYFACVRIVLGITHSLLCDMWAN